MTEIVDVLSRVARQVSISPPSSWVNASADEYAEIRDDFLMETIDDLQERIDWPSPIAATVTIAGTGAEIYALPADFKRLQRGRGAVFDVALNRDAIPVSSDADWREIKDDGAGADRFFRLSGYDGAFSISLYAPPTTAVVVHYVSKKWMASAAGTIGSEFTADGDVILFPRRLVEAGIVWRWRERKGLPFQDKHSEYEALIARAAGDARGSRPIEFGQRTEARWQDRIPAFIPSS